MPALIALVPQLIALVPVVETGVGSLIKFIGEIRTAAMQTGEWTAEHEKTFLDALVARNSKAEWKTDAEIAAGK